MYTTDISPPQLSSREVHLDSVAADLEERQRTVEAEMEAYTYRRKLYEDKEAELEAHYDRKFSELEAEAAARKREMDAEYETFKRAKENFDTELKVLYYFHFHK